MKTQLNMIIEQEKIKMKVLVTMRMERTKKMTEAALMRIKYENTSEHNQINVFQKIDEIFGLF